MDFELSNPTGFDVLSDQFQNLGALFDSSIVATAPAYNYQSYPPRSGAGIATPDLFAGVSTIYMVFLQEAIRVRGYVTSRDPISLQCFATGGALLAQQDFVGGNTGLLGGPVNHEMVVSASGIQRCMLTGTTNAFSLDDLTIVWGAPDSVDISVSRTVVFPFLGRTFNAVTQQWADQNWGERRDTVVVTLRPRLSPRAGGIPDTVVLKARPKAETGLHSGATHGQRPGGTWYLLGQNTQAKGRAADSLILVVSDTQSQVVRYRTSGVSGEEWVSARVASRNPALMDSVLVSVRVDGLVTMERSSNNLYLFTDQTTGQGFRHGNFNNYADPMFRDSVEAAFNTYLIERDSAALDRFLNDSTRFMITEASLPFGGLFDCDTPWEAPGAANGCGHQTHRTGQDMDIRILNHMDARMRIRFLRLCREQRLSCAIHGNTHFHIQALAADRRFQ